MVFFLMFTVKGFADFIQLAPSTPMKQLKNMACPGEAGWDSKESFVAIHGTTEDMIQ